ncbi:cytotoxic and regulatory T-cell molecule [Callorhinchus milii]|uniref:cytotoxic and regulatory T-cell molecule n=1 Tax=Callorhinchus milii TaxID=7868 RepID=UPI001C3FCED1|nr:cytotoxic and regulatory T-cell molecule [Callorhinchus milii]
MALSSVLCLFFVLSVLPANSQHLEIQKITVLEGEPAILNCTINGSESAVIEWKNPRGYVIFFTNMRGLKDTRYKLVNFSNTMLIVSLLNTTVEDGGTYTCLQYGYAIETKQVLLRVLAPPNRPTLSMTKHELHGEEKKVFTCITTGSKPKPQITWLLNNEVRLQVHTTYELENNGLKFTTTSTLKIIEHYNELRIDCLVEHEGLTNTLRATLQFGSKSRKIQIIVPTNSSEKDESITSDTSSSTDYNPLRSTESYTHTTNEIRPESMTENSTQNAFPTSHSFFTSTEDPQILTNESETSMNSNSTTDEESPVTVSGQSTLQTKADLHTSFYSNSTESNSTEQHEEKSENRSNQTNQMKHSTALILILIAFLICALFIIIQLFVLKVRKEHMKWKKQNDDSEQTVESNRSNKSSNEDNFRHESNNREQNLVTQYAVRINSVEHLEQQHSNGIHEDHLNKTEKESDV